jgi:hypothetical protein
MNRIDDRTVELDPRERIASEHFDLLLDKGWGIEDAIARVRYPTMSAEFEAWLR